MPGYGAFAEMMASHQTIEVFKRFSTLNLENILHMQAELQHLEAIINEVRRIKGLNDFDSVWIEKPESMSEGDIRQVFERSRGLLDEYCRSYGSGQGPCPIF
jgi:hypothetical protein